ncbi:DUF2652 domain-containing protein [Candidatus Poribacteria bacterium]|nr:DUF2652 domain-containing protein [Candidatus Poribacteria bacterium]
MVQTGYLLITDITGYTQFLTESELEHAHQILQELMRELLREMRSPLRVSNYQGDAVLAYARRDDIIQGQTLLDTVEGIYGGFAEARDLIHRNTRCTCTACQNTPTLDLKAFVHMGSYIAQRVGDHEELSGPDVILAHRLMKNTIRESTGVRAYASFTSAALDAMDLPSWRQGLIAHRETYEHVGVVEMGVHDLSAAWQARLAQRHVTVDRGQGVLTFRAKLPVPPSVAWDLATNPARKRVWLGMSDVRHDATNGRLVGLGTTFHCAHDIGEFAERIVGWKPFEFVTFDSTAFNGVRYVETFRLTPDGDGTRIDLLVRIKPAAGLIARFLERKRRDELANVLTMALSAGMAGIEQMAAEHRDDGQDTHATVSS